MSPPPDADPAGRADRLAAALRANLKRRKAQAKGRDAADDAPIPDTPAPGAPAPDARPSPAAAHEPPAKDADDT